MRAVQPDKDVCRCCNQAIGRDQTFFRDDWAEALDGRTHGEHWWEGPDRWVHVRCLFARLKPTCVKSAPA
jgi:hypothetical protein